MRMRRRRVERLLARATEAYDSGREDAAREALAEIAVLSPLEPRLAELRARLDAPPPAAPVAAADAGLVASETPAIETVPRDEITRPVVTPVSTELSTPSILLDLPLVIDEPGTSEAVATAGPIAVEATERQPGRSGRAFAFAAAALLACGAFGWFAGPPLMRLVSQETGTRIDPNATVESSAASATAALPTNDPPDAGEPLAPVQVAVDEVAAADTTVDAPAEEPQPVLQPTDSAAAERGLPEPAANATPAAPARREPPSVPDPPPPAPISIVSSEPGIPVERPAPIPERPAPIPTIVEHSTAATRSATPTATAGAEPSAPAPTVAPAARESAPAVPRDEDRIRAVLDRYAAAYSRLDASAANAIFPGVDRQALARAFDGLVSQNVSLGSCDIRTASEAAIVDCAGSSTWTPKIGGGTRTEARRWQFRLRNESGDWRIVAAKVR